MLSGDCSGVKPLPHYRRFSAGVGGKLSSYTFSGKRGGVWGEIPPNLTHFELHIEHIFFQDNRTGGATIYKNRKSAVRDALYPAIAIHGRASPPVILRRCGGFYAFMMGNAARPINSPRIKPDVVH
jgi:hypothetical protein